MEVLLRKPPPATAAPFLKRVQFLFEGEDSVQNYAKQDAFDSRYVFFSISQLEYLVRKVQKVKGVWYVQEVCEVGEVREVKEVKESLGAPGAPGIPQALPGQEVLGGNTCSGCTISQTGAVPFRGRG